MDRKTNLFQRLSYRDHRGVSRGPRSVVNSGLTFHRVTTLQIGHRKLLKRSSSRILSDILISKTFWKSRIYSSRKMLWVVGKSRLGLAQLARAGWVKLESAHT